MRGYSLIGKTAILHIVISGSSPDNSILIHDIFAREAQPGGAEHWSCFGYKFKSYLEHLNILFMGMLKYGNQVPLRME